MVLVLVPVLDVKVGLPQPLLLLFDLLLELLGLLQPFLPDPPLDLNLLYFHLLGGPFSLLFAVLEGAFELLQQFFLLEEDGLGFLPHLLLPLLHLLLFQDVLLEVELGLGVVPVDLLLFGIFPRGSARQQHQEHVVGPEAEPVEMEQFLLLDQLVAVEVAVAFLPKFLRSDEEANLLFLLPFLLPLDGGVEPPDSHPSDFDCVGRFHVPPADSADLLKEGVADLSAELGVLVQVGDVGLGEVNLGRILLLLLLLMLLLRLLGRLPVVDYLVYIFLLILCLL